MVLKKRNNFWLGRKHTEKSKRKMSAAKKGKHLSPKTEFKKGDPRLIGNKINVGRIPWNKDKKLPHLSGKNHPMFGKKISKEAREKKSKSMTEKWKDPDYRKHMVDAAKASKNKGRFEEGHEVSEETRQKLTEATLKQYEEGTFPLQVDTKPERKIKEELLKRGYKEGVDFIHQYRFMNKFMCDFCFPAQKLIVEADGDFWHANPQIYPDRNSLHEHQVKGIKRDKAKNAYIQKVDNGEWTLLRFWETDINSDVVECVNIVESKL